MFSVRATVLVVSPCGHVTMLVIGISDPFDCMLAPIFITLVKIELPGPCP